LQAAGNRGCAEIVCRTSFKRVKHNEHDGGIRYVDEAVDRQPLGRLRRSRTPGSASAIFDICLTTASVRSSEGRIGQLGNTNQVVFVLHRYEAGRNRLKAEEGQCQ
jgi:hypothetical protein